MNNAPENHDYANSVPYYAPEKKKNVYTLTHAFFAVLTLILGSLWHRWVFLYYPMDIFKEYRALPITVFTLVFLALSVSFFRLRKTKIGRDGLILMTATLVFSLRFALYPDETGSFIFVLSLFVLHVCALLFLYCVGTKNSLDKIVGSTARAVFAEPFLSFHSIFASFSAFLKIKKLKEHPKEKSKQIINNILLVLLALFIAIPILTAVISLLGSDGFFADYLGEIYDFFCNLRFDFRIGEYFNPLTVLVSMFIFGALFSSDKRKGEQVSTVHDFRSVPEIMSKTVLISLLAVYLLFMLAQINGFCHMLTGSLPDGVTYADFARSGFFELCTVACINGAALYFYELLTIKNPENKHGIIRILLIIFTLLLIFTAAAKMIMYISAYGFTPKRFYTLWFMLLLTALFFIAPFKLKNPQFKLSRYSVYITLFWLAVLFLVDFEAVSELINARYFIRALS